LKSIFRMAQPDPIAQEKIDPFSEEGVEGAVVAPNGVRIYPLIRIRIGLTITLIGFIVFLIGARPSLFGLDRSPVIGFVQIAVFLVGLGIICIGGYTSLMALWKNESPSIAADFGQRLVATGFVVTVFAGMADVFGFGSHPLPEIPYFGPWQASGVLAGEMLIALGFILLIPFRYLMTSHPISTTANDQTSEGSTGTVPG
jgi:hypothetical protein